VCLGNSVLNSVLRVGITVKKFEWQVVKFCYYGVSVEDRVSELEGSRPKYLL